MSKINKFWKSKYFPFAILFIVMLGLTATKKLFHDDSEVFAYFAQPSLSIWVHDRFFYWSSRIIIEIVLGLFASQMNWLWRITDSLMYVILGLGIYRVFITKNKNSKTMISVIVCMILLIPQKLLSEAGWMATSLNYLWPVALGIVALIPIRKCLNHEKMKWFEILAYTICLIFAENMEQVAIVLFTVYLLFTIYFAVKRNLKFSILLMVLLSIASLVFILLCPGNASRASAEIQNSFVDYRNVQFR